MSIFSRRKRTRRLVSLAISAVATSLCSSQVALCLPFVVSIESFSFDGNNVYILGCDANNREQKFEMEIKVGKYEVYLTSENSKFEKKINRNTRYIGNFSDTINFSDRSAESKLDILKQKLEKEQRITQEKELKRKQNKNNVNEICNLIGKYERCDEHAERKYSIEINAKGDSELEEDLRDIILHDPIIQDDLKYVGSYFTIEMINGKLRKITITKQEDKYCIEVKLKK